MNPAIFASQFHPYRGGVEELVRQMALDELRVGNHPLVLTMRWPKSLPAVDEVMGLAVRRHVFRLPESSVREKASSFGLAPMVLGRIMAQLLVHRSDVVHVQCVAGNGWYAEKVARLLGLPLVVTLQGELTMDATAVYERSTVLMPTLRRLLRTADLVTACSEATLREAEALCQVDLGTRGVVVHNGVRVSDFTDAIACGRGRPYLFAIGRLVSQKGFDVLLRAFRKVIDHRDDIDLLIAGEGAERPSLTMLADELGLGPRVEFVGAVDREVVPSLFKGAVAFVLPSLHEPFGIVNLEAMASGIPVLATRVGGVAEIVEHEVSGLLVSPASSDDLAAAIERVVADGGLRSRLVEGGLKVARLHDWSLIALQYREMYARAALNRMSVRR